MFLFVNNEWLFNRTSWNITEFGHFLF